MAWFFGQAPCSNPDAAHGGSEIRTMYGSASVNAPEKCKSEKQKRQCSNGLWGAWSGSCTVAKCSVKARCSNPDMVHGGSESRTMYGSASVTAPEKCKSEKQTRQCSNGLWGAWSGNYTVANCSVKVTCATYPCPNGSTVANSDSTLLRNSTCCKELQQYNIVRLTNDFDKLLDAQVRSGQHKMGNSNETLRNILGMEGVIVEVNLTDNTAQLYGKSGWYALSAMQKEGNFAASGDWFSTLISTLISTGLSVLMFSLFVLKPENAFSISLSARLHRKSMEDLRKFRAVRATCTKC